MNDKAIEIGDFVKISFAGHGYATEGEVLYVPQATGDAWHIKTSIGELVYVQMFEQMTLVTKYYDRP